MQMIKKNWVYILFVLSVIIFSISQYRKYKTRSVYVKARQINSGWGYDIYVKDSVYISQDIIPSINGRKTFVTKTDAEKVGELMVLKMKKNQIPNVTEHELDSLKITR